MKKHIRSILLACTLASGSAHAALVFNGDFETGDLSGFSTDPTGIGYVGVDGETPHAGDYGAYFAGTDPDAPDTISQTIATIPGNAYRIRFFLQSEAAPDPAGRFVARFGGSTLLRLIDPPAFDYTAFSADVTASAAESTLSFTGYNLPAAFDLDDVSVVELPNAAVPEPGTAVLLGLGLFGLLGLRARERAMAGQPNAVK